MTRKTELIIMFSFLTLLLGITIYNTSMFFIENEVPLPFAKNEIEPYISYEDGGQEYGINSTEMVNMINAISEVWEDKD